MPVEVDLAVAVQLALNIVLLIGAIVAGWYGIKRWLQKQVVDPATKTYEQVAPNGGNQESTRHLIEETRSDVSDLTSMAKENREIAVRAEALAKATADRLDTHLLGHPTRE